MKWIDTADDAVNTLRARGDADPRVLTRDEWRALKPEERQQSARTMAIAGVRFRGSGDRTWLVVSVTDVDADRPTWTIWDMRRQGRPEVILAGVPDLALALSTASLAGTSPLVRRLLGGATVLVATGLALGEVWRRR
jgi:hypothetical protein